MDLYDRHLFGDLSLNTDSEANILKTMDLIMIKLEGGTDEDLQILDKIYSSAREKQINDQRSTVDDPNNINNNSGDSLSEHESGMCSDNTDSENDGNDEIKKGSTKTGITENKPQIPQKTKSLFLKNLNTDITRDFIEKVYFSFSLAGLSLRSEALPSRLIGGPTQQHLEVFQITFSRLLGSCLVTSVVHCLSQRLIDHFNEERG